MARALSAPLSYESLILVGTDTCMGNGVTQRDPGQVARHPTHRVPPSHRRSLSGLFSVLSCGCCVATPASWHGRRGRRT